MTTLFIFLAVLGLRFCARAFSSCGKWGPLFITVRRPLTIAAYLVAEHRLQMRRLSSCGSRAQLLRGMWDLPSPGLELVSPALAGRLSTTAPPGKPSCDYFSTITDPWNVRARKDLDCPGRCSHVTHEETEAPRWEETCSRALTRWPLYWNTWWESYSSSILLQIFHLHLRESLSSVLTCL